MIEYKSSKAFTMGIDGRTVTGIFCVHGNVDDGDGWSSRDRSMPGVFGDFSVEGRRRAVFLWQHNSYDPPIATIDRLFEVSQAELPPAVRLYAPDAIGGVGVTRTYLDTPRANEVLAGLNGGALTEMSYAYDVTEWSMEKGEDGALPIRNILKAELYDVSDVNWGMNPATSADGSKGASWKARPFAVHSDAVKAAIAEYLLRVQELTERRQKEGRVFSAANYAALKALADDLEGSIGTLRELLSTSEPKTGRAEMNHLRSLWVAQQQRLRELGVPL